MRERSVWRRACGLTRTVVEGVDFDDEIGAVIVTVRPDSRARSRCGLCGRRSPRFDRGEGRRRWRALDLGSTKVFLEADAPRVRCRTHAQTIGFGFPFLLDHVIEQRRTGAVPDDQFVDPRFADLMQDHLGTVARLYEQLGLELTSGAADRMRAHLEARPRGRHGPREYRFEHMGLDEADMRARFAAYMDRYVVPQEAL